MINIFAVTAQHRLLKGTVKDTLGENLEFANIMAKPSNTELHYVFGLTDKNGKFELKLAENTGYRVTISFMGYDSYEFKIDSVQQNITKNIQLKTSNQFLDEVVIESTTPMKITKDSIVYDVKHFVSGKEFKLKSVLKKLPGISVDRNGQITVMGKKVSQVFVEDKPFFGGNSELAVENLPANVIEKIKVINDYNQVSFMKGLNEEQKMIINIKLKEGKKRFVFGDLEAGANLEKNYLGKASLFYYSPKTNLSYIGNINDIGEKSLSTLDVSRFEGGRINNDNSGVYKNTVSPLRGFLMDEDYTNRKVLFNAIQWQQDLGDKWSFRVFGVSAKRETDYQSTKHNSYLSDDPVDEVIDKNNFTSEFQNFGKLTLTYKPTAKQYFDYSLLVNKSLSDQSQITHTVSSVKSNEVDFILNREGTSITQDLNWYRKFNKKNIVKLTTNFGYKTRTPKNKWLSENPILETLLPLEEDDQYEVNQVIDTKQTYFDFLFKYYYKLNSKHHIYFSLGGDLSKESFRNNVNQILENNIIDFDDFRNDYSMKVNDLYFGIQYRFKLFGSLLTPGIYAHNLSWYNSYTKQNTKKILLLPRFDFELETMGKIKFRYQLKVDMPGAYKYSYNYVINSFNTMYKGNTDLSNELYHELNLNYSYATFGSRIYLYYNLSYIHKLTPVKNKFFIDETDTYFSPVNITQAENIFSTGFNFSKEWRKIYIRYSPVYSYNRYYEFVDDKLVLNKSNILINRYTLGTHYRNYPELEIGLEHNFYKNELDTGQNSLKFREFNPFANFEYNYKGFSIKTDYKLKLIKGNGDRDEPYHFLDASLIYNKEDKPFGIEFSCTNILNTGFIESYYQSSYLYSHGFIYKQPRIWMVRLHYKL